MSASRGNKVGLVVINSRRAEALSRMWRKQNDNVRPLRKTIPNDLKVGKGGTINFVSAQQGAVREMVSGKRRVWFIEPDAYNALSPDAIAAVNAASVQEK